MEHPTDNSNKRHPGPGWVCLPAGTTLEPQDVFYGFQRWVETKCVGKQVGRGTLNRTYFRYDPSLALHIPHEDD